jgi:hypothetical protein
MSYPERGTEGVNFRMNWKLDGTQNPHIMVFMEFGKAKHLNEKTAFAVFVVSSEDRTRQAAEPC